MHALLSLLALVSAWAKPEPRMVYAELDSAAEGRPMRYAVYEPPGWDRTTPLPLLLFLHGGGDDETAWDRHPAVTRRLDQWITEGRLPPFLAVVPNGDVGFWADWHDGTHHYATYLMDELLPAIYAAYPLKEGKEDLHLMGISMGGAGTIYLGLDHLDRFGSLTAWSAPILDAEGNLELLDNSFLARIAPLERIFGPPDLERIEAENAWTRLQSAADLRGTRLMIGAGRFDIPGALRANRAFHGHLTEHAVPHRFVVYGGGHVYSSWSKVFPVALCMHLQPEGACELEPSRFYRLTEVGADGAVLQR